MDFIRLNRRLFLKTQLHISLGSSRFCRWLNMNMAQKMLWNTALIRCVY